MIKLPIRDYLGSIETTPETIKTAVYQAQKGEYAYLFSLFRHMIKNDPHLSAVIDTRILTLQSKRFTLLGGCSKFYEDFLTKNFMEIVKQVIYSKLFSFSVIQLVRTGSEVKLTPYENKNVDWIKKEDKVCVRDNETDKIYNLSESRFKVIEGGNPLLQPLTAYYLFKAFAVTNWASFTEIFGKPVRIGKYLPGTSSSEKEELWDMLLNAGTDLVMMTSENIDVQFLDFAGKSGSGDLYERLAEFCNKEISKRILGQTMTTEDGSSLGQAKIHNYVRKDILEADARFTELETESVLRKAGQILGIAGAVPRVRINTEPPLDLSQRIKIDKEIFEMGFRFSPDYIERTYNIKVSEEV